MQRFMLAGKWMSPEELLELVDKAAAKALATWEAATSRNNDRRAAAQLVHDALVLNLFYGHMPPLRVSCVISIVIPSYNGSCK